MHLARITPRRLAIRLVRYQTVRFAQRYLRGLHGLEIGGASHVDFGVNVINVDRSASMDTVYKRHEIKRAGYARPVDLVASGEALPIGDDSVDFVLASHVIEHMPDPIAALLEWTRVARYYLFLVVPHRDRTFDRDRPLTPLTELVERHEAGFDSGEDRHWSVWNTESFLELCDHLGLEVVDYRDPDHWMGLGFALVISARPKPRVDTATQSPGRLTA